jgi:hypothetical protein
LTQAGQTKPTLLPEMLAYLIGRYFAQPSMEDAATSLEILQMLEDGTKYLLDDISRITILQSCTAAPSIY